MKIGMRVRSQYRSALERQVGEATSILMDQRKGICLLNSKSEFNRCSLPRLTSGNHRDLLKELREDEEEDKAVTLEIKRLRKVKKEKEAEEKLKNKKRKNPTLEEICKEMKEVNRHDWNWRRMQEIKRKKLEDLEDEKETEKMKRLRKCEKQRTELLSRLRKNGTIELEGRDRNWIEKKKEYWRKYRCADEREDEKEDVLLEKMFNEIMHRA